MVRILGETTRLCDGVNRRELLRVGGLGLGGLTLPALLAARGAGAAPRSGTFGRARSCLVLYLVGGPPQHETWDPKPDASADVRGAFRAISTPVDGLQVGELMPRVGALAAKYSVIRSMATDVNAHTGSGFLMLTGHPNANRNGESIPPSPADWPTLGAVVQRLLPSERPLPVSVTLPESLKNNPGLVVAGQNAGFMGAQYNPLLLECDPSAPDFEIPGLSPLPGFTADRLGRRRSLLESVNRTLDGALTSRTFLRENGLSGQAWDLLTSTEARRAFDLRREPPAVRERYGAHKFGQSCLLARRLLEAGVRLVTVHWPREPNDLDKGNPVWDTHLDNNRRLKENLMPPMDQAVSAVLEDLDRRGLLDETLVICMGEFGRTPKFNPNGGRDHWGHVFSLMLAGAGIKKGVVHGSSDRIGGFPETDRETPENLHATIHHLLGIPPGAEITDALARPLRACDGEVIHGVLA